MKSLVAAFCLLFLAAPLAAETINVKVGVLRETHSRENPLHSRHSRRRRYARRRLLGAADNNTTGKFTNQTFEAIDARLEEGDDVVTALDALLEKGALFIIADLSPERLLAAAERAKPKGALLFNVSATDDRLREEDCRANVIHVAPTRSMLADGLAQYLVWKQWRRWLLIKGSHPERRTPGASLPQQRQEIRRENRRRTRL